MCKPKIAILFGGHSSEYDISLQSAYSVIKHINKEKYEPILLGITRSGKWHVFSGEIEKISNDTWDNPGDCTRAIISPDRETKGILIFTRDKVQNITLDAAMPVLHGKNGEDGTVQGLLQLAGIPIIGCNTLSSALCMDKDKAHKIVNSVGIRTPNSFTLRCKAETKSALLQAENIGYPLFVKPVNAGSSLGITKVACPSELPMSIKTAFEYDNMVIVEEAISGFEVGCAILGDVNLTVGQVSEVELSGGFFDYKEKYAPETSAIHIPARIPTNKADEVKETAKTIYRALNCSGFARVDMFLTANNEIVFNEVNTIPGFAAHSRYPKMLKAVGMTFEQVIDRIIKQGIASP